MVACFDECLCVDCRTADAKPSHVDSGFDQARICESFESLNWISSPVRLPRRKRKNLCGILHEWSKRCRVLIQASPTGASFIQKPLIGPLFDWGACVTACPIPEGSPRSDIPAACLCFVRCRLFTVRRLLSLEFIHVEVSNSMRRLYSSEKSNCTRVYTGKHHCDSSWACWGSKLLYAQVISLFSLDKGKPHISVFNNTTWRDIWLFVVLRRQEGNPLIMWYGDQTGWGIHNWLLSQA